MIFGIIGLGRMGLSIAQRVHAAGLTVIGFDPHEPSRQAAAEGGIRVASSLQEVITSASVIWIMVPAAVVDQVLESVIPLLTPHHIVIEGGNSHFPDTVRRAQLLAKRDVVMLDCGTSGGLHGKEYGFSLMVGGDERAYKKVLPLLQAIAAPGGVGLVGPSGAGHYVKMVHNGIEYGLMQAYAEGFQLLKQGSYQQEQLDLAEITRIWNHGSIIRSWLLGLSHDIFKKDQKLDDVTGVVEESGTGRWTVDDAHKHNVPVTVIEQALAIRARSRQTGGNYATKVVALLRNAFGGHKVTRV